MNARLAVQRRNGRGYNYFRDRKSRVRDIVIELSVYSVFNVPNHELPVSINVLTSIKCIGRKMCTSYTVRPDFRDCDKTNGVSQRETHDTIWRF